MSEIVKVKFEPRIVIKFSLAEIDALMKLSAAHYDGTCRAMGKVGGTIYGLRNYVSVLSTASAESYPLSFHEVNLMAKCCEIYDAADIPEGATLYATFTAAMKLMNQEEARTGTTKRQSDDDRLLQPRNAGKGQ
jgi:hypothetical protein